MLDARIRRGESYRCGTRRQRPTAVLAGVQPRSHRSRGFANRRSAGGSSMIIFVQLAWGAERVQDLYTRVTFSILGWGVTLKPTHCEEQP